MVKFLKFFLGIAVLLVLAAAGVMTYRLWDQGELKTENFTAEAMGKLIKQEAEKLGSDVKEGSLALKNKIQHEWVDWEELKGNWTLSEDEFEKFKNESLAFLSLGEDEEETAVEPVKKEAPPEKEGERKERRAAREKMEQQIYQLEEALDDYHKTGLVAKVLSDLYARRRSPRRLLRKQQTGVDMKWVED
ncbi:MAG: hypothetical protein ACPHOK_08995, partial [Akkermansiaceae bacterium]